MILLYQIFHHTSLVVSANTSDIPSCYPHYFLIANGPELVLFFLKVAFILDVAALSFCTTDRPSNLPICRDSLAICSKLSEVWLLEIPPFGPALLVFPVLTLFLSVGLILGARLSNPGGGCTDSLS